MNLNLGCGHDHKQGWINADVDPSVQPNVVVDITQSIPFGSGTADKILMQDVLEHLTKEQALDLLRECRRILKPQGKLILRVPNVFQIIKQFQDDPPVMMEFLYGNTQNNGVWGAHKYGYTPNILKTTLTASGFINIKIQEKTTNYQIVAKKSTKPFQQPHILLIIQSPDWGGAEEWITNLVDRWSQQQVTISGYTNLKIMRQKWANSKAKVNNLPVILDISGNIKGLIKTLIVLPYAVFWYVKTIRSAKKHGANVLLMSNFSDKLLASWIASIFDLPSVWFEYGPMDQVFKRNFYLPKILYRLTKHIPQRVLTISKHTYTNLVNSARISTARLKLIYPGVNLPNHHSHHHQNTVGYISRIAPEKGQRLLIQAWPQVIKQIPEAKLIIAGTGPDAANLKTLAKELKIHDSVIFPGFIKDKSSFYQNVSLFVFPSIWDMEGFGLVLAEAMSYRLPVIAFNRGPVNEIVDESTGILVSNKNINELAKAMLKLLKDKDLRLELGQAGYTKVKTNYFFDSQSEKILSEIKQVVHENQNR